MEGRAATRTVPVVRTRLVVLLVALVVWVPAVFVWQSRGAPNVEREVVIEQLSNPEDVWAREDLFSYIHHMDRVGGYLTADQRPQVPENPDRVRILVFGDSATWGDGLTDPSSRWPDRLGVELADRTVDGAFEVVTVAVGGSSTFSHLGWLQAIEAGDVEVLTETSAYPELLAGDFDVFVLGFSGNDILATPGDPFLSTDIVEVPWEDHAAVNAGDAPNPNQVAWEQAVTELGAGVGDAVPLFLRMYYPFGWFEGQEGMSDEAAEMTRSFTEAGFRVVRQDAVADVALDVDNATLLANPANRHPGDALQQAMAVDVAAAVLEALPAERVERARAGAAPQRRPVVANHLPASVDVVEDSDVGDGAVSVRYLSDPYRCSRSPGYEPSIWRVDCEPGKPAVFTRSGEQIAPQHVPCAELGHPHVYVGLDPYRTRSDTSALVDVTLDDSSDAGLVLFAVRRDATGSRTYRRVDGPVGATSWRLAAANLAALVVADVTSGCSLEVELDVEPFEMAVEFTTR